MSEIILSLLYTIHACNTQRALWIFEGRVQTQLTSLLQLFGK